VPKRLLGRLGLAIGRSAYRAYSERLASNRWRRAFNAGARPQRLLFASTGTKDPGASDILYVKGLNAPLTVNTVPESTLKAFADHGELDDGWIVDERESERVLGEFREAGIDLDALAEHLQQEGAASFVTAWNDLLGVIAAKTSSIEPRPRRAAS
jgi:transaldolase